MIPVFISKLQDYIYLKRAGLLEEFQLVDTNSVLLGAYRHTGEHKNVGELLDNHAAKLVTEMRKVA